MFIRIFDPSCPYNSGVIGIVLAGGTGSRLWPITKGVSKQLLPIFDKPMVHYPISTIMTAGIREIIIITTPQDQDAFKSLLGTGEQYGVEFIFLTQFKPEGLAQAFLIARKFITDSKTALILGDNLFYGVGLGSNLSQYAQVVGAQIFGYEVANPSAYGVVEFNSHGEVLRLEEKPIKPKSNFAVPGLYFYDEQVLEIAGNLKPSKRGELEITSVNEEYLRRGMLRVSPLSRGTAWLDTGTFASLHDASSFVRAIQERQGVKIACLEEIGYRNGWIDSEQVRRLASKEKGSEHANYLLNMLESKI